MADAAQPAEPTPVEPIDKRPRGKALRWPGAKLSEMSEITADDIERARERWKQIVPSRFKGLLDAQPVEKKDAD